MKYDPLLENFVQGSGGKISTWDREKESTTPLLIRGLSTNCQQAIQHCLDTGRKFIYMDTGYLGNYKHKTYHRLTVNNVQHLGPLIERPYDRIKKINYKFKKRNGGDEILICPPSKKLYNKLNILLIVKLLFVVSPLEVTALLLIQFTVH
jgi:hypothetical protein